MNLASYIGDNFGSKQGIGKHLLLKALGVSGYWRQYKHIPFDSITRLVFICNGNICRSPLAEFVAEHSGFPSISFGLDCTRDASPDPRAVNIAAEHGYDMSAHRARPIADYVIEAGDLIVGMEPIHVERELFNGSKDVSLTLLGLWGRPTTAYIHDPFNTNDKYFRKCEEEIIERTKYLLSKVQPGQKA